MPSPRALATLRFFWNSSQGPEPDATGYRGFYYHFLDMHTGARTWQSELSTVDTALLIGGMLTVAAYFDADRPAEREIRELADQLYARVDWQWAQNGGLTVTHGWTPESGFLPYRWKGYDEALLLYVLGLGSARIRCRPKAIERGRRHISGEPSTARRTCTPGRSSPTSSRISGSISAGSRTRSCASIDCDYFENSRRATLAQQAYAIREPAGITRGYGDWCWGITASDGPGNVTRQIDGVTRQFFGYMARGVPDGPDDGTLAPWGVMASLPFAPEIVLPTIAAFRQLRLGGEHRYGYRTTFNPTFPDPGGSANGWVSPWFLGLNQGPIVIMIENHRSGLVWRLLRNCRPIVAGLRAAGFTGGWLGAVASP